MKTLWVLSTAAFMFASGPSWAGSYGKGSYAKSGGKDIVQTAQEAGSFKTLVTALEAAGLVDTLKGKGPFTVFAPTDEAFAKISKADLEALLKEDVRLIVRV